jgi:hypothetical protein
MDLFTKRDLLGMLGRATRAGRVCGAIAIDETLITVVPWSHPVIAITGGAYLGTGVSPITGRGGSMRELYNECYTLAVAWELAGRSVSADIAAHRANGGV